ncbi:MAG: selenium cofactor biosynthesis protein YqeC [Anaerolineae bacterium]|nr:selenium cofactor biosynthesis protein YqeC [Anaerolineae bacterium]
MVDLSRALGLSSGDVVAFVGGGGKTTAMFRLAKELAQVGSARPRVLTTTTTRIFAAQIKQAPAYVSFDPASQTIDDIRPQLDHALRQNDYVLLIGRADPDSGKAFGVEAEMIDALAATGSFDFIINEADGSRMRPLKAPAEHEPVIPHSTTIVVPVVGLDALGQPLQDEAVHRPERVSRLSGTPLGQPVTIDTISALVCHPQGGLKAVPAKARVMPLLNKLDHSSNLAEARDIAKKLLSCSRIEAVLIGAVQTADSPIVEFHGRTAAIILAAGGSSRFGSPKQLARWHGATFIEHVVNAALGSQADPVVVVLGAEMDQSRAVLDSLPVQIVYNRSWAEGQSTSMKLGLEKLAADISGVIFLLVDLPAVTSEIIDTIIDRYRQTMAPLVWPEFEGQRGNPVLFDRTLFPALRQVSGDTGGRPVLIAHQEQAERVAVRYESILQDIDRPEDIPND